MIRIALKNLWSQRRVYCWLSLELIILSILAWIIVDETIVRSYYANQPIGYDSDRLAYLYITTYPDYSPKYSAEATDSAVMAKDFDRIYSTISSWPGVKSATVVGYEIESRSGYMPYIITDKDTVTALATFYLAETPFFSTYGIKPADGKTMEKLEDPETGYSGLIVTESIMEGLGKTPQDAAVVTIWGNQRNIAAVTKNLRMNSVSPQNATLFYPIHRSNVGRMYSSQINMDNYGIVIRVEDGIDPAKFVDDNSNALKEKLSSGNLHMSYIQTYSDKSATLRYNIGYTNSTRIGVFLAIFFLVNMALGVIGTVWLQTRRRAGEAGVMKAFGARPRHIITTLIWEGVILTTITWMLGSFIFLQYALKNGLAQAENEYLNNWNDYYPSSWVTDFWVHFGIVALIILALMLIAVVIGIWIPARRIARVDPAVALKDE